MLRVAETCFRFICIYIHHNINIFRGILHFFTLYQVPIGTDPHSSNSPLVSRACQAAIYTCARKSTYALTVSTTQLLSIVTVTRTF